jgi:haloalkane dehalogenase
LQQREIFRKFRTPGEGEKLILEGNAFVERVLPAACGMRHKLTDGEMAIYRAPFPTPESRKPTWRFPNELPIAGGPADVYSMMSQAHEALAASTYPKLLFAAEPGGLVAPAFAEELAGKLNDCRFVKLGDGIHFLQEDHPETIGRSVAAFIAEVEGRKGKNAA